MIGIRVPDNSDLPERFKKLAYYLRLQHHELLERLVAGEEHADQTADTLPATVEAIQAADMEEFRIELKELRRHVEGINEIKKRLEELEDRAFECERANAYGDPDAPTVAAPEEFGAVFEELGQEVDKLKGLAANMVNDVEHQQRERSNMIAGLKHLHENGKSLQQIADQLNGANVPTLSGKGIWNKGTIAKLLRN
jgi:vacuolar-type H+-ATPase subunit I/STV1